MSTTHATTADELWGMPRLEMRHELVRGELRTFPFAGAEHGVIAARLLMTLCDYPASQRLGIVLAGGTGFHLASNPDTVRAPDAAFIRRERVQPAGIPEGFWPGAPDLAGEVVSPDDTVEAIDDKVADWLEAGAEQVWVIKPKSRTVAIHQARNVIRILSEDEEIAGGEMLPGFRCPVADLFPR